MLHHWNRQALLETLVYLFGAFVMGYFTVTKKYLAYVTPRMEPFLYFMVFMLVIWALGNLQFLGRRSYKNNYYHILILFVPLLLLFLPLPNYIPGTGSAQVGQPLEKQSQRGFMSDVANSTKAASNTFKRVIGMNVEEKTTEMSEVEAAMKPSGERGAAPNLNDTSRYGVKPVDTGVAKRSINGKPYGSTGDATAASKVGSGNVSSNSGTMDDIGGFGGTGQNDGTVTVQQESDYSTGINNGNRTIVLNDGNYYRTIMELTRATDKYVGYQIKMTGYVIRDKSFYQNGDFFLGRMAMTCCIADLAPVGLAIFYQDAQSLPTDGWYTITGTVVPVDYHGMPQAGVKVTGVTKAAPINDYVYP